MKYRIKSLYDNIILTFFSGTDTHTLQVEGSDRNNFVSLIVNNAGVYTAAITRKVEYTENHQVEIKGTYPFFGTKRVLETPVSSASEEKKKQVVEYFELTVEKQEVQYNPNDYDEMFNNLVSKKLIRNSYQGYQVTNRSPYYPGYPISGNKSVVDDDDDEEMFNAVEYYKQRYGNQNQTQKAEQKKTPNITEVQGTLFSDTETFDEEFVKEALATPILAYKLKELLLEIVSGSPIITKWVKTYDITDKTFVDVLDAFKEKKFTPPVFESFIHDSLLQRFEMLSPDDYFPKTANLESVPPFQLENTIIIKMIEFAGGLPANDFSVALVNALKDFYSV